MNTQTPNNISSSNIWDDSLCNIADEYTLPIKSNGVRESESIKNTFTNELQNHSPTRKFGRSSSSDSIIVKNQYVCSNSSVSVDGQSEQEEILYNLMCIVPTRMKSQQEPKRITLNTKWEDICKHKQQISSSKILSDMLL
ncbi:unnamed protein product [Moneuplotes crassus]|uniref:Uncharacterized protein n=1 Tax=Euplotes crassus TaxID=5936 RepID=A0AAD2D9K0_EUPCR|nr:unnamed protein product [Moneuplotes crassus]